jgi:hypothetical protein
MDTSRRFDIVRRENENAAFFLEGAPELSAAKSRVEQLLSFWPGQYQIFDLETKQAVVTTAPLYTALPESNPAE